MSKKILILSGSPRKGGNSETLCDQFMKGAAESGHEVEKILIWQHEINMCIGCYSCENSGKCVFNDDMAKLLDKMIAADVLVLASPVYFYTINAQIKALIDRCVARYREIRNKEMYYIIAAADTDLNLMKRAIECFRGFAVCLPGSEEKGIVYGVGAWKRGEIKGTKAMQEAYELGKNV